MAIEPNPQTRRRTTAEPWSRLADNLAVVADLSRQARIAALGHDAAELAASMASLRIAILDAIAIHNTSEIFDTGATS